MCRPVNNRTDVSKGSYCLGLKIKAVPTFETSAEIKQLAERNMPEDLNIDRLSILTHRWELSSYYTG